MGLQQLPQWLSGSCVPKGASRLFWFWHFWRNPEPCLANHGSGHHLACVPPPRSPSSSPHTEQTKLSVQYIFGASKKPSNTSISGYHLTDPTLWIDAVQPTVVRYLAVSLQSQSISECTMHDVAAASMTTLSLFSDILLLKSDANFRAGDLVGVLQTSPGRGKSEAQPADRSHWPKRRARGGGDRQV